MRLNRIILYSNLSGGAELSQLHSALNKEEVGGLVIHWSDLLKTSLTTAKKCDHDYKWVHNIYVIAFLCYIDEEWDHTYTYSKH